MTKSKRSAEKEEFWRLVIQEQRQSGLSVRTFCQAEGVSVPSFYAWRKKIEKRDAAQPCDAADEHTRLIPVDIVEADHDVAAEACSHGSPRGLEIVTPGGFTLRCGQSIQPRRLGDLLEVVVRCDRGAISC